MTQSTRLRKEAGIVGLLYASVGGIVGSGWLFGPLHAAQQAGPLSLWSWVIGAGAVLLLALVYSELATLIPKSGALVHICRVSHGALLGNIWSWILFFAYVTIAPVEVMAVLTYANNYLPGLIHAKSGLLTSTGFLVSVIMLGFFVALNFLVIRWVLFLNSLATWWKPMTRGLPAWRSSSPAITRPCARPTRSPRTRGRSRPCGGLALDALQRGSREQLWEPRHGATACQSDACEREPDVRRSSRQRSTEGDMAGTDVSGQSVADAKVPLKLRWYGGSYIEIPVRR